MSTRQIERNFKRLVGMDISQYRKRIRFEKAIRHLDKESLDRLTDVAFESGYYDQPHFNADFKELAEIKPKNYQFCMPPSK